MKTGNANKRDNNGISGAMCHLFNFYYYLISSTSQAPGVQVVLLQKVNDFIDSIVLPSLHTAAIRLYLFCSFFVNVYYECEYEYCTYEHVGIDRCHCTVCQPQENVVRYFRRRVTCHSGSKYFGVVCIQR